jgi:hypothetical protein
MSRHAGEVDGDHEDAYETPTTPQIRAEMVRLSRLVDKALGTLHAAVLDHAQKDADYRRARALAHEKLRPKSGARSGGMSEADVKAQVDAQTYTEMLEAHLAKGLMMASFKAVDARLAQLSAVQTMGNQVEREMRFAQTGPRGQT